MLAQTRLSFVLSLPTSTQVCKLSLFVITDVVSIRDKFSTGWLLKSLSECLCSISDKIQSFCVIYYIKGIVRCYEAVQEAYQVT